ncbi:hypothetical protein Tco_0220985, partial [Tanacetum coccineum]
MLLLSLHAIPHFSPLQMFLKFTCTNSGILSTKKYFRSALEFYGQNFDEPPTDEVIVSFFKELGHTGEIKSITDVVVNQMHQPWRTFATIINRSLSGKTSSNPLRDDYLINTLRFVFANEESQICEALLPESMTSPEMWETKAY